MAKQSKGEKFPLLIYRRWSKMLRLPALLICVSSGAIWWFAPDDSQLAGHDWGLIILSGVGALIFIYSLWARQTAYVQCFPSFVKIRTPFLPVAISYQRIVQVRPVEFYSELPLGDLKRTQHRLLEPFLGQTIILLELKHYPVGERRLRSWLPWFMFASKVTGFLLVVEDWMALSRQMSIFSDRWVARRQARQRPSIG